MLIPERSSGVKKWIVPLKKVKIFVGALAATTFVCLLTFMITVRYFIKQAEFNDVQLQNRFLEGKLQLVQDKLASSEATLVRIQNFEQKLRVLAKLDQQQTVGGFGPITGEEQEIFLKGQKDPATSTQNASSSLDDAKHGFRLKSMEITADELVVRSSMQEQSLQQLYELLKDQRSILSSTPSVWPAKGWLTSRFGYRTSPFTGESQAHAGIDIAAPTGTRVVAPADGVVTSVTYENGYGKVLVINHGYGVTTRYGHNSEILVKSGQRVRRGETISLIGSTGRATGPHLHYEVRLNGIPVNPARYILN